MNRIGYVANRCGLPMDEKQGSKSTKNTKVQSRSSNRSHGGKIGSKAGKAAGGRKGKRK